MLQKSPHQLVMALDLKSIFGIIALCDALDDVQLGIFSESLPEWFCNPEIKRNVII